MQFLDDSQVRSQCPTLSDGSIFTNLETNINKILANTYTGQIPNVGYIQECIVNQGFEYMQQFDVYRFETKKLMLHTHCSRSSQNIIFKWLIALSKEGICQQYHSMTSSSV